MILPKLRDRVRGRVAAALSTDESRWSDEYIVSLINSARAEICKDYYFGDKNRKKNRRINPLAVQKCYVSKDDDLQDNDCLVKFPCPAFIGLGRYSDGVRFIGKADGTCAFDRARSRGQLANFNKHSVMSVTNEIGVVAMYDGTEKVWEIYNDSMIKEILVEGIFNDPREVPMYNQDMDEYPLNEDYIPELERLIFQTVTGQEAQQMPDYVSSSDDVKTK